MPLGESVAKTGWGQTIGFTEPVVDEVDEWECVPPTEMSYPKIEKRERLQQMRIGRGGAQTARHPGVMFCRCSAEI
jgi:hypothetical protein